MEVMEKTSVLQAISQKEKWEEFLAYKTERQHLNQREQSLIEDYIRNEKYIEAARQIEAGTFPKEYALKKFVNKSGTRKKRVVYSFSDDSNIALKFIAYHLYVYDAVFEKNCYAFRRNHGVKQALGRLMSGRKFSQMYCYKVDIQNYFNSIDVELLLEKMKFILNSDPMLYGVFQRILQEKRVQYEKRIIVEEHGAMAGIPIAPFFANMYLQSVDKFFYEKKVAYFRYSDDVLIFAETKEQLEEYKKIFAEQLRVHKLTVNSTKMSEKTPGEAIEFLGFAYCEGQLDLSENTKSKIKGKIKRKAEALRRWQRQKGLTGEKAAIGFINAMNKKFFGHKEDDDFTWERWFFPNLTVTDGLREIDHYMQQYIRYCVTGRHYKGNFRITYEQMKDWGYRNLVHEYYEFHKQESLEPEEK